MRALAAHCTRHRRLVLLLWLAALLLTTYLSGAVGTAYSNSLTLPNTESARALALLRQASPREAGDTEQVVWQASAGRHVTDPAVAERISRMLDRLQHLPHVTTVLSPYQVQASTRINASRTIAFALLTFDRQGISASEAKHMVQIVRSVDGPGLRAAVAGQVAAKANPLSVGGTGLGIALAAVVLLLVFGNLFATILPIVSALASLGTAIGLIGLISHVMKMPDFSSQLVLLIGLGVGVDYALFIVTRHRQGLIAGRSVQDAVATAVDTSGRAVLFAGIIVCIALLGMYALGVTFLYGMAVAAAIGVAFTMVASLTLLPALLTFIGPRILSRRQKRLLDEEGPHLLGLEHAGFWSRWADIVQRHALVPALVALGVIALVAAPATQIRLGTSDQGNDPLGTTTRQAYDLLAAGFGPGFNGPLELLVEFPGGAEPRLLSSLQATLRAQPDVASVADPVALPTSGRSLDLLLAYPRSAPQSAATATLIDHLRAVQIPRVVGTSGARVLVGGTTAIFVDFSRVLSAKLPLFIGVVVLLSFVLLAVVFRSLVVPLTAACMNLLSVAAAFGMVVAVFQWGWLGGLIGADRPGPVDAFLPVMLFAILFGLSMDYEVFLVTRIHEDWLHGGDNRRAVRNGLASTGKTITAAACIMILVFASFLLGGLRVIKEFGVGLAGGVLVDAIVIRMGVVPALMQLLGRSNWWFPRWLDRALPRLAVDPEEPPSPAEQVDAPETTLAP